MTHCVLLKFKPGTDLDAVEASVRETYEKLDQLLPFLTDPVVFRNCVEMCIRDSFLGYLLEILYFDLSVSCFPDCHEYIAHIGIASHVSKRK